MKQLPPRLAAVVVAVVASLVFATASPAGAQTAPSPLSVLTVVGSLLTALRGPVAPPASAPSSPIPAPVPAPAPAPAGSEPAPSPAPQPSAPVAFGDVTPMAVEAHLAGLRYDVGPVDGNIDEVAASAIMAFQKVHGLDRTGRFTDQVGAQILATSGTPAALVPNNDANKVEIDLTRQVLFLYEGGSLSKILPVSSGTAATPTPTGSFRVYRQARGWETSYLGRLYNSQYFVGGYAIHGSLSVPNYPASHGCVRLPMSAAEWFPEHVSIGTPVYVLGG